MRLAAFIQTVYLPSRVELSDDYCRMLTALVARYSTFLERPATLHDLNEAGIAAYLASYCKRWSAVSTNNQRRMLLTLWRAAFDWEMVQKPPRPRLIRHLTEEISPPEAWTWDQVGELVSTAATVRGEVDGISAADWWVSLILTVFWTGCRIGALLKTPSSAYHDGRLIVRESKTRKSQVRFLPESCCQIIDATNPHDRELLWPWPHDRRWLYRKFRRIVTAAGLPCPKTGRQPRQSGL